MGLDIYVIPLWRFLANDFETVAERGAKHLGLPPPKIVTSEGIIVSRSKAQPDAYRVNMFKRKVRNISERVGELNRPSAITWNDEGDCVYSERCWDHGMKCLRTYALWLCHVDASSELSPPPDNDFYKHPIWARRKSKSVAFPHLIDHDCYMSYYLPCDFAKVTNVEKVVLGGHEGHRLAASSVRLQCELQDIAHSLESNKGLGSLPDTLATSIRQAYEQMKAITDLSCKHGLPIIFWG